MISSCSAGQNKWWDWLANKGQGAHSNCRGNPGGGWTQKDVLWLQREGSVKCWQVIWEPIPRLSLWTRRVFLNILSHTQSSYFFTMGCLLPATLDGIGMLEMGCSKREKWEEEERISENSNHSYLVHFRDRMEFGVMYFNPFICKMSKSKQNRDENHRHC